MTNNTMREAFAGLKAHERHANAAESRYWCQQYKELAKKLLDEQAAQSAAVPVVGDAVAYRDVAGGGLHAGSKEEVMAAALAAGIVSSIHDDYFLEPLIIQPINSIPAAELATLREKAARLEHELETERMRLAACGVIARANTENSAIQARDMLPEYRSASAQDCADAVDREMDYRSRLAVTEQERDELRKDAEIAVTSIYIALDALNEIIEMDGQDNLGDAKREATKAMAQLAAIAQGKGE